MVSCILGMTVLLGSQVQLESVESVFEKLAGQLKHPLVASKELRRIRVFVDPKSMAPELIAENLARLLHATLKNQGGTTTLVRTSLDRIEMQKQVTETRKIRLDRFLHPLHGKHSEQFSADGISDEFNRRIRLREEAHRSGQPEPRLSPLRQLLPSQTYLLKLLQRLGPQALAEASQKSVTVWEDQPVYGANPLPYHYDVDALYEAAVRPFFHARSPAGDQNIYWTNEIRSFAPYWGKETQPTAKLRLSEISLGANISFHLEGYDRSGALTLKADTDVGKFTTELADGSEASKHQHKEPIELTPEELTTLHQVGRSFSTAPRWLIEPAEADPLNFLAAHYLRSESADLAGRALFAIVPDSLWDLTLMSILGKTLDRDRLEQALNTWSPYHKVGGSNIELWEPEDPAIFEAYLADRKQLARFTKEACLLKRVEFRNAAQLFASCSQKNGLLPNTWEFLTRVGLSRWDTPGYNLTAAMYRLIGSISETDYKHLLAGESSTVSKLGIVDEAKELLLQEGGVVVESDLPIPDLFRHANELFNTDTYGDIQISLRTLATPLIQERTSDKQDNSPWAIMQMPSGQMQLIKPLQIDLVNGAYQADNNRDHYENVLAKHFFRIGHADDLEVTLRISQHFFVRCQSRGYGIPDTDYKSYTDLPEVIRDGFWKVALLDANQKVLDLNRKQKLEIGGEPLRLPPP